MVEFSFHTTSEEASEALSSYIKGRTVLITGVTLGGLGQETARVIALHSPKLIILAGRSPSKVQDAQGAIKTVAPETSTRQLILDLASLAKVRAAAEEVNGWTDVPTIDIVINNAGIMARPFELTEDRIESQFGANHIGHFLFTQLIIGKILASGSGARVVNLSSNGYKQGGVRWNDWNFEMPRILKNGKAYNPWQSYGQSKTANILYAKALGQRYAEKRLKAYSVHPGGIWTNLGHHAKDDLKAWGLMDEDGKTSNKNMTWKTLQEGTSTTIVAAFDPSIANQSGAYLEDCHVAETPEDYINDPEGPEKLWRLSEKLTGQSFDV